MSNTDFQAPYFDSRSTAKEFKRRLLLLSPHFPPGQAAGALRWQKFAHYAANRGWGLDVVAYSPESLGSRDDSRLEDLPAGIRVYGVPMQKLAIEHLENAVLRAVKPFRQRQRGNASTRVSTTTIASVPQAVPPGSLRGFPRTPRQWVRAYDAAIDYLRHGSWARKAAKLAQRVHEPGRHQAVISSGPPYMTHEGARLVAAACSLPLVIDMRDPWRLVDRLTPDVASPVWRNLSERYEGPVVAAADLVVMNTPLACNAMREQYPERAERIITVLNGWDDDPIPTVEPEERFLVAFVGAIYLDRDPTPFFRAAGRVVRELKLTPEQFGIEFLGHVDKVGDANTADIARAEGLAEYFVLHPPGPRRAAQELLARATLLLNLPQSLHKAIPSKLYEYMLFPAWLLSLSEAGSSTAWLVEEAGGDSVSPDAIDDIAKVLHRRITQHQNGGRPPKLASDPRFGRHAQADRLFRAIDEMLERRLDATRARVATI